MRARSIVTAIRSALLFISLLGMSATVSARPLIEAGDMALRHDIQRLADAGLIKGTTSTWPLAWGPILADIERVDVTRLSPDLADSLLRLQSRGRAETVTGRILFSAQAGIADEAMRIRSYQDTPRGKAEVSAGLHWLGERLNIDLNVQGVDSAQDDDVLRFDHSMLGLIVGNWSVAASTQARWWGPAWDGSLILSNNARPIPALTFDRLSSRPFESRWLGWIGPWDLSVMFGQLEKERAIPNAQFFGLRFNFRPAPSLEIGFSRSAQWCGDGRPCDLGTFGDLLLGKDNRGDEGVDFENEPGNQLAGFDLRWSPAFLGHSVAVYGQFIGEDEAGGFPSKWLGQVGAEWTSYWFDRWSARIYAEFADTTCQFYDSPANFNCAYNHGNYRTGYRFRSRSIGYAADNDARLASLGFIIVDADNVQWRASLRLGELNRGGAVDSANTLTATSKDLLSLDLAHSRTFYFGVIDVGAGYEMLDDIAIGESDNEAHFYVQWRSSF
tara:strand:- start:3118 stop:4614 length:1497 start_codon:yes stop_codon:yes gene_type:complete